MVPTTHLRASRRDRAILDAPSGSRAQRRDRATADTRATILQAARECMLADGYANLSTRHVAEGAGVPLSQIHYHFGSKQQLILAVLDAENARLLERQRGLYSGPGPLWRKWERAVEFLDDDIRSGYVRILQEMIAASWSDPMLTAAVTALIGDWFDLLANVAVQAAERGVDLGPFDPREVGALMALPFVGAEPMLLLGIGEGQVPIRATLRKVGTLIRAMEEEGSRAAVPKESR
ncbi:MAG: TetR/AcrR family transcriptional regulator [Chloroflexi bacterium]|nr:TetR/AcrR family transcriptional regulator [Chloroflexota bacterium]